MQALATTRKTATLARTWTAFAGRLRRLTSRAWAGFGRHMLRGAASALGAAVMSWLIWWLQKI
ncbi:hypothetical protein BX285_1210 [Streptomyces sp. 1114.5]|nr:hypothetical protein BX285_1210 [Streptomyces sp. 1114.5]